MKLSSKESPGESRPMPLALERYGPSDMTNFRTHSRMIIFSETEISCPGGCSNAKGIPLGRSP